MARITETWETLMTKKLGKLFGGMAVAGVLFLGSAAPASAGQKNPNANDQCKNFAQDLVIGQTNICDNDIIDNVDVVDNVDAVDNVDVLKNVNVSDNNVDAVDDVKVNEVIDNVLVNIEDGLL